MKTQVTSDVRTSDHDRIEKLLVQVAELQKKVAQLTQEYEAHTHQLRNLEVGQMPDSIECDEKVVQWSSTGIKPEPVYKACRQLGSGGNIKILVRGSEPIVIGPPRP